MMVTWFGEITWTMMNNHPYAMMEHDDVIMYTLVPRTYRTSPSGMQYTQTAEMTKRLNAALPTTVAAPSSPENMSPPSSSIMESRISGADEPRAMSVRLATVSFQNFSRILRSFCMTTLSLLVMISIAAINTSEMMAIPK